MAVIKFLVHTLYYIGELKLNKLSQMKND